MSQRDPNLMAGSGVMFFSAAIFGFFGFFYFSFGASPTTYASLFMWTLKIAAVGFLACGAVTFANPFAGNLAYGILGLIAAVSFLVVAGMDQLDPGPPLFSYSVVVLSAFALWNGWNSWTSVRTVIALRDVSDPP